MMINRRNFIFGTAITGTAIALGSIEIAGIVLAVDDNEFCVPAAEMRDRAVAFRQSFYRDYLLLGDDPYPISDVLTKGRMLPISNEDTNRLLDRGKFEITVPDPPTSKIRFLSNAGTPFEPVFACLLVGEAFRLRFYIPSTFRIKALISDKSLSFSFVPPYGSKLKIKIVDKIYLFASLYDYLLLTNITLTDEALVYQFEEDKSGGQHFSIRLNLTDKPCPKRKTVISMVKSFISRFSMVAVLASTVLLGSSCITTHGNAHGVAHCLAPSCPDQDDSGRQIVRVCDTDHGGVIDENGETFFRIDHNLNPPNSCTYIRADDLAPRCSLYNVCAGVELPRGWFESKKVHDPDACEHPGNTGLLNVKIATRCFDITITPKVPVIGDGSVQLPDGTFHVNYNLGLLAAAPMPSDCAKPSYTYSLVNNQGNLPAGVNLSPTTGLIFGPPAEKGIFKFTVAAKASDTTCEGQIRYTLIVN